METRQLKYFVAVAEELHFGNAARRLHISQPPLSQQIMKFEDELGVKLFRRNKRSVSLTSAGRVLLEDARVVLNSIERAQSKLKAVAGGHGGRLRLGYIGPALETPFGNILREFRAGYPDVQLSMEEMFTNAQLEAIREGRLDAGAVRLFRHDVSDLRIVGYHRESYALVVPDGHGFSGRDSVDVAELAGEPLVFYPRDAQPLLYDEWMRIFAGYGFVPRVVQEVGTKTAALAFVSAGIGISIVPESLARRNLQGIVFCRLSGRYPELEFHLVCLRNREFPALLNFMDIAAGMVV